MLRGLFLASASNKYRWLLKVFVTLVRVPRDVRTGGRKTWVAEDPIGRHVQESSRGRGHEQPKTGANRIDTLSIRATKVTDCANTSTEYLLQCT